MDVTKKTPHDKATQAFPVVGIGASAGGLKAAEVFLKHTPADSGMAYVLVFHLDPKHKSEAAALLQRHTEMPVTQVKDRTRIEPDRVYVIPPNHGLSLVDGHLALTRRKRADGRPTVIDHFFRTLAEHAGEHAIGIVLSGTGSEGSQGLKAIKEAGGLAVVQDETEAEYAGMPHSAIATELIDFILPVAEIPAKLREIGASTLDFALPDDDRAAGDSDVELLQKIFVQLRARGGHDFSHYKQNTVMRRIARRMQVHQLHELAAYLDLLRKTPAEADALFRELLISVTNFFRDPEAMEALERDVIPQLCKRMEGQSVRVWVPGCATGEEAYSLAMLLGETCEGLAAPPRLQVFATDVDERALAVARRGVYPGAIVGDVSEGRLKRFFERTDDGFVVKGALREMILFTRHDLLQDPPFSRLDLVSCRNLLIYLKAEIQPKIFALFHFALKPQSYLFLGGAESVGTSGKLFGEIDRKAKIFRTRRAPVGDLQFPLLPNPPRDAPRPRERGAPPRRFEEIARDELLGRFAPPCVIVGENYDVTYISGRVGKYLEPGAGVANYNILDMAREELRLELRTALFKAFRDGESMRRKPVCLHAADGDEQIRLTVRPLPEAEGHMLVVFEEAAPNDAAPLPPRADGDDDVIAQLETELTSTRESLQTSIEELETSNEELRASNEELQSTNEELQSTTEELETGREELQSTNEELLAVNQELQTRNDDLARANGDLGNLAASTEIATLFLDGELRVRRYSPRATDIFNLIASDIGRPLAHLTHKLHDGNLVADAERVLRDLAMVERDLASTDDCFYQTRLRPYRTTDNKVDGVVLTFVDVTDRHRQETRTQALNAELAAQKAYGESIIAAVREPMLVLDGDLHVVTASRAFYRDFKAAPETTEHVLFYELGERQWDIPDLRRLLDEILPAQTTIENFEVRHDFGDGERSMLLNARRLHLADAATPLILLAFEDITERMRRERWLEEQTSLLERIASDAALKESLGTLCDALARLCGNARVAVLLANEERSAMERIVATDIAPSFGHGLAGAPINELFVGTCGTAIFEDKAVTCPDIPHDTRWSREWRDLCEAHGVRACHSTPVHDNDGIARASLLLCFERPHELEPLERRIGEFGAHVASIAIQRERASRALRESEEKYRSLFDTMDDGLCIIEMIFDDAGEPVDFRYLETNAAFVKHATRPMLGKRIKEIVPDFEQAWLDHYGRVAKTGEPVRMEGVVHGLGDQWFQTSAVRFGGAGTHNVAVLFSNTTARKLAERESVQLASIVDSSDDAIISKNLAGIIGTWNASAEQMFGYAAAEAIGQPITSLIIPADRMDEETGILQAIARGEAIDHFETVRKRKDDSLVDVSVTISPLVLAGHVVGASKIARDIGVRKRREADMTLLAEVSFDLVQLHEVGATMDALGARIGAHFGLSLCLFVELDEAAQLAVVNHGWHREGVSELSGSYRIGDFVGPEFERRARAGETIVVRDTCADALTNTEKFAELGIGACVIVPVVRDGQWRFWFGAYRSEPHDWRDDEINLLRELTSRIWTRLEGARAGHAVEASENRYRTLFESIDEGFCIIEMIHDAAGTPVDYRFLEVNPAFEHHTGLADAEGRTIKELVPEQEQHWFDIYAKVAATGEAASFEQRGEGMQRTLDVYAFRIVLQQHPCVAVLFRDISEREHAAQHRELLIHELNHRVKNTLATVQALAMQTFRGAGSEAALDTFDARLLALSAAHDVLTREDWVGADIRDIVRNALAAWSGDAPERIRSDGPELRLRPAAALALAMALHELATNAVKYGALSDTSGTISIDWRVTGDLAPRFGMRWQERGGPPVRAPSRHGFGSRLIEQALARDLGGSVELFFDANGVKCLIDAPLDEASRERTER